ncbi:MAG: NAD(P)H-dependent oxidoreductase [Deltaproteobacteria bacterium]|nr:NAD(P)H-dependent oxidoreductase [Deltaproteobacteria bacterium]
MSKERKDANKIDQSRRELLKVTVAGLLVGVTAPMFSHPSTTRAAETVTGGKKMLITYYSRTGNTREVANQIHQRVGGEIIELQTVNPYPEDYEELKKQAMQELKSGFKPELKIKVKEIGSYDVIFVGTPIWWGTMAAPVKSFLSRYDLSGKTIAPFITHAGSGLGQSVSDMAALCPHSRILDGLAVWGNRVHNAQENVSDWLHKINIYE